MSDIEILEDEPVDLEPVRVAPHRLRGRIRELIAAFMAKPRPLPVSDADLLNDYLDTHSDEFSSLLQKIAELKERLALARGPESRALERELNIARAERSEVVAEAAMSEEFQKARAEAKASYNIAIGEFEDEEEAISALRPFLGMPHLPAVDAEKLSARAIVELLSKSSPAAPKKGQMVLQMPEAFHRDSIFAARSALGSGLDRQLIGRRKTVPVPFDVTSAQAAEATGRGAFERSRRIHFLLGQDRPECHVDWKSIDDFLPFAYRSLTVPMMPLVQPVCTQFSFEEAFGADAWKLINDEQVAKSGGVCNVCGSDKGVDAHPRWIFREPLEGSFSPGVATLSGFTTFCGQCANSLRPDFNAIVRKNGSGSELSPSKGQVDWLRLINRWTGSECDSYARKAYLMAMTAHQRRSRFNWIIDLSAQRSLFFCLEAGFSFSDEGWIFGPDEQSFKVVGTPVFDRDRLRHYYPSPDIFELEWGTSLSAAELFMKDFDMALADKHGTGQRAKPDQDAVRAMALSLAKEGSETDLDSDDVEATSGEQSATDANNAVNEDGTQDAEDAAGTAEKTAPSYDLGGSSEDERADAPSAPRDPVEDAPGSGADEELGYDPSDPRFKGKTQEEIYEMLDAEGDEGGDAETDYQTSFCDDILAQANAAGSTEETGFH